MLVGKVLLLLTAVRSTWGSDKVSYTVFDEVSWNIRTDRCSDPVKQIFLDEFMQNCIDAAGEHAEIQCLGDEQIRLNRNVNQPISVRNYTKVGFKKIRAPEPLMKLLYDFWEANKDEQILESALGGDGVKQVNVYTNANEAEPAFLNIYNESLVGGGNKLKALVLDNAKAILEEWSGQRLIPCSIYGIRVYQNTSVLAPHVDRLPLVSSAIINVAQDVEEPWPLEVFGHDGYAVNVTMEPGDMVLYESHAITHGRPFPMNGKYMANIFIHFEPVRPLRGRETEADYYPEGNDGLPPYVLKGSPWANVWREKNPNGWKFEMADAHMAAFHSDFPQLHEVAETNPDALHRHDDNGWTPMHEVVRGGHLEALKFLLSHGVDMNAKTVQGITPLWLSRYFHGDDHPVTKFLESHNADEYGIEL